jgi:arginine/ornithine N-succinyltransferase beta subunit
MHDGQAKILVPFAVTQGKGQTQLPDPESILTARFQRA